MLCELFTRVPQGQRLFSLYLSTEKIHVNQVLARDDSPAANIISMHVVGEGPGAIPSFKLAYLRVLLLFCCKSSLYILDASCVFVCLCVFL